jgi:ParB family transcriptional regulator, chromosome partitioning protein
MGLRLINVPIEICDYPSQPRSHKPPDYINSLAANIRAIGQKDPVLGWMANGRFQLGDGGCRLEAMRQGGFTQVLAMDLGKEPSKLELLMAQASIDLHRQHLPPVDRARLYRSIMTEKATNGKETAEALGISPSLLSRYLPLLNLDPDLQALVNRGEMDWGKGSLIALATSDHEQQRLMAKEAQCMTRDSLAAAVRKSRKGQSGEPSAKLSRLRIPLDREGQSVMIAAKDGLTVEGLIGVGQELVSLGKQAQRQEMDIKALLAWLKAKTRKKEDGNGIG